LLTQLNINNLIPAKNYSLRVIFSKKQLSYSKYVITFLVSTFNTSVHFF